MKGIKQIKNFRLTREIGKGASGVVYEAVDDLNNKLYAVKAIPSSKLEDKRVMENFKRELKLLHGLNHNNIIKIVKVEKTVNNIYLILDYCNGGNLYEFSYFYRKTFNRPLPEKNVQQILRQLIEGLEYMHNCRTVHRDIKLENILVNFNSLSNTVVTTGAVPEKLDYNLMDLEDISIKIADLGYARELEGAGVASTICGTPITMAPDIINLFESDKSKDHKYNSKVDLWSLGAITYELIVGRPPFYASNYKQLFEEVLNGKYNLPKSLKVSIEAITFINGLLQFYPEKRMNWDEIRSHPFMMNDASTFHLIDLHTVENDYNNPEQLEVDTKDCENFLWFLFKTKTNFNKLDKIDQSVIFKEDIINNIQNEDLNNLNNLNEDVKIIPDKVISDNINNLQRNHSDEVYEETENEINIGDDEDEKSEDKPKEDLKKSEVKQMSKSENRVFDRIFSEMKQELKNNQSLNKSKENSNKIITNDNIASNNDLNVIPSAEIQNNSEYKEVILEKEENSNVKEVTELVEKLSKLTIEEEKQNEDNSVKEEIIKKESLHNIPEEEKLNEETKVILNKEDCQSNPPPVEPIVDNVKESQGFSFESLSEERESNLLQKENIRITSENLVAIPEQELTLENEDDMWEIISTNSVDVQLEFAKDGYQFINEYFK